MERLTEKHYSGNGYYLKCSGECPNDGFCDDCEKLFKAIDRLGEHEDKAEQKPKTNADRFRAMSDEEQQKCVRKFWEIEDFADWLQQPAEGE